MIPNKLEDWDYNVIKELVGKGFFETDRFDLKEDVPRSKDIKGKERLEKTVCAFANTEGGFLIFGIKDNKSFSTEKRIIGIDSNRDFPREVGDRIVNMEPQVYYTFRNPPIKIPEDKKVIHVLEVPKSPGRPHMTSKREFYYRTNRGNIPMSYQQIKDSFLEEEKRMEKLRLLFNELLKNRAYARELLVPITEIKKQIPIGFLDSNILQLILLDGHYIIKDKELIKKLSFITEKIRVVDQELKMIQNVLASVGSSRKKNKIANEAIGKEANQLISLINESLKILTEKYGFSESESPYINK